MQIKNESKIGFTIFIFDILSFVIALCTSNIVVTNIANYFFYNNDGYILSADVITAFKYSFVILAFAILFIFYNKGHYSYRNPWWSQIKYISGVIAITIIFHSFIYFSFKEEISRLLIIFAWIYSFCLILISRQLSRYFLTMMKLWKIDTVMFGDHDNVVDTLYALASDSYSGYNVNCIILRDREYDSFSTEILPDKYKDVEIVDGRDGYEQYVMNSKEKFFILALDAFRGKERDKIMDLMEEQQINFVIVPPSKRISLYGMESHFFFGHDIMFLSRVNKIKTPFGKINKRLLDIFGSVIGLAILFLPLSLVALLIRLDGGPIFYGDRRVGKDGKIFICWKFRSMRTDADKVLQEILDSDAEAKEEYEKDHKLKDDPRITKVGKIIRKASVDELPQLFNILKGEMSIVGPRPISQSEIVKYGKHFASYESVKPGLTGMWQVSGRNDTTYERRIRYDEWYIRNWSLWHDIVIIFKTINVVIGRSGAY